MSSHIAEFSIRCWSDCKMAGCPSHKVKIEANNTSNALTYSKDGEMAFGMDFNELGAFVKAIYSMRHWVEIDQIFKEQSND